MYLMSIRVNFISRNLRISRVFCEMSVMTAASDIYLNVILTIVSEICLLANLTAVSDSFANIYLTAVKSICQMSVTVSIYICRNETDTTQKQFMYFALKVAH